MVKCSFCSKQIPQGEGIIYVELSGKVMNLCSAKCRKNFHMGRDPKKLKWITKAKEE